MLSRLNRINHDTAFEERQKPSEKSSGRIFVQNLSRNTTCGNNLTPQKKSEAVDVHVSGTREFARGYFNVFLLSAFEHTL